MRIKQFLGSIMATAIMLALVDGLPATAQSPLAAQLDSGFTFQGQLKNNETRHSGSGELKINRLYAENQELKLQPDLHQQGNEVVDARITALGQTFKPHDPPKSSADFPIPWLLGALLAAIGATWVLLRISEGHR